MRVALIHSGTYHWLAGQPGVSEREFSSVSNYRINEEIATQQNQRIRAANAWTLDRGNLATQLTFGTTRKFPTAAAAQTWANLYSATTPRTGVVALDTPLPGGGSSRCYLDSAVVRPPTREVIGVTVMLTYTIDGSRIVEGEDIDPEGSLYAMEDGTGLTFEDGISNEYEMR